MIHFCDVFIWKFLIGRRVSDNAKIQFLYLGMTKLKLNELGNMQKNVIYIIISPNFASQSFKQKLKWNSVKS